MDREGLDLESQFCLNPVFSVIVALFGGLKYPHHSSSGVSLRGWACKTGGFSGYKRRFSELTEEKYTKGTEMLRKHI